MPEAFSLNREYDYVRLGGLSRATGRTAHEWDTYILKELIDNALDAAEFLWKQYREQFPSLRIQIQYLTVDGVDKQYQQLLVSVANRAQFPVEHIKSIFDTQWYTSRKAFIKRLTRGTLGNALKTLLGIPYALHNCLFDDWEPDLNPLTICCNGIEYLPRYFVDTTTQAIRVDWLEHPCKPTEGTRISMGLDYFDQEKARTLLDLQMLAHQYYLCNPHTEFEWTIDIGGKRWSKHFIPVHDWIHKFLDFGPIHWYSGTAFRDLLGALYREAFGETQDGRLPIQTICRYLGDCDTALSSLHLRILTKELAQNYLTKADINGKLAIDLYKVLSQQTPHFDSSQLGWIGAEHIEDVLKSIFPVEGKVQYYRVTAKDTYPNTSFIVEVAAVPLTKTLHEENEAQVEDGKRQVWTAINFTPTYGDPFLSRWLYTAARPNDTVLGIRGVLDAYNIREDTPFVLFLHLICPTTEHTEFSKTEIDHRPFEKELSNALDSILTAVRDAYDAEELQLEQTIFTVLDEILQGLGENELFVFEQLMEQLRVKLGQHHQLTDWLERPDMLSSLRNYIANYQRFHPDIDTHLAFPDEAILYLPSHPQRYLSIPVEQVDQEVLEEHYVNKIIYLQNQSLEPTFIKNNWLCEMDLALLHVSMGSDALDYTFSQCITKTTARFLVIRNADETGQILIEKMHSQLKLIEESGERLVDIQLPSSLMTSDFADWLLKQFATHNISTKFMPSQEQTRDHILQQFDRLLQGYILLSIGQHIGIPRFLIELNSKVLYNKLMQDQALDELLKVHLFQEICRDGYGQVLEMVVEQFLKQFIDTYFEVIQGMVLAELMRKPNERNLP